MGIDIYLRWRGQTKKEREEQFSSGFSTGHGHIGYLREAYHGGPYATKILVREAFEARKCRAVIPAAVMLERLTHVTEPVRGCDGGHRIAEIICNALSHQLDADPFGAFYKNEDRVSPVKSGETQPMTVEEAVRARYARLYPNDDVDVVVESFRNFVKLAEQKELETGRPCIVYASY